MRSNRAIWTAAIVLTLVSAVWQRLSGPTHPTRGTVVLGDTEVGYRFTRSHSTTSPQPVRVERAGPDVEGEVRWRRYPTSDPWQTLAMTREGGALQAFLPAQVAAGKLEYQVRLRRGGAETVVPTRTVVTRFKDEVSTTVLITHVACMFAAMMFSAHAGFAALAGKVAVRSTAIALALWTFGGLVLGPIVQKQAFGEYWTGIPFGTDLTDNKTLIAVLAWAWAAWRCRRPGAGRGAVMAATLVTFGVFAIPHSAYGSEVDWTAARPLQP
jgi:hypothetical protein